MEPMVEDAMARRDVQHSELIAWMRERMTRLEWSISDTARRLNIAPSMVSRWLAYQCPSPPYIREIARVMGGDEDELLAMAGYRERPAADTDEVAHLVALLRRAQLTPDRYWMVERLLRDFQQAPK